jgi:uncharacterized protein (UPF0548 family)
MARAPREPRARRALEDLHAKPLNFDATRMVDFSAERGWRTDDYRQSLPGEPAGPPLPDGSWEAARRLMRDYEFADPKIVRAIYYDDARFEQRDMLLELRFHGLRFHAGVRIGGTRDETTVIDGRRVRVWGWNYGTLHGHLEMGQMDFEVWKWLDTGAVEFRIHAVSRPAAIRNPIIRLGFRLFGRRQQLRFARHACQRMAELVIAELAPEVAAPIQRTADNVTIASATHVRPDHRRAADERASGAAADR